MAVIDLDIQHLAELARIHLTEDEIARFGEQIREILGYVAQLQAIETEGVAETAQVTGLMNVLRDDQQTERIANSEQQIEALRKRREELLAAVAEKEADMVKVPAIL